MLVVCTIFGDSLVCVVTIVLLVVAATGSAGSASQSTNSNFQSEGHEQTAVFIIGALGGILLIVVLIVAVSTLVICLRQKSKTTI